MPHELKYFISKFLKLTLILSCIFFLASASYSKSAKSTQTPVQTASDTQPEGIETQNDKISFYFQNIDIRTLLELIAKTSGNNFIISDAVKGTASINLKNVTWQQALDVILQSRGLALRQIDDTIFISTTEEMTQDQTKRLQSTQDIENLSPLSTSLLTLKYMNAGDVAKLLKGEGGSILTTRGEVAVDARTNSIIIRDIKTNLSQVVQYVKRLDIPTKQVSIEARVVLLESDYESQLGVKFGISNTRSLSGSLFGADQLAQGVGAADVTNSLTNPQPDPTPRLNFNLPAAPLSTGTQPASVGLALARLGPVLLDLELSALEEENHSQTISKPRVVTSNQEKAFIQTGQDIPYAVSTSSGATSIDFRKAVLGLEITPQITPNNKILLKLKVTQDQPGSQLFITPITLGPPVINTQAVESNVVLNDNETVVLGGIYKLSKTNRLDRVPFFSNLPIFGNLFKHRSILNKRTELLVFITPKIIKPGDSSLGYAGYKGE